MKIPANPSPPAFLTSPVFTDLDRDMMRRALGRAREAAALGEVPVGAVIYDHATGLILGEGHNRREIDRDPTAHAEVLAIHAAARTLGDWRMNHCSLAVTLEPCTMCAGAIVHARLGRLLYATPDPKAGACGSLMRLTEDPRLNHRVAPITPPADDPLATEAAELLRSFFRKLRSEPPPPANLR